MMSIPNCLLEVQQRSLVVRGAFVKVTQGFFHISESVQDPSRSAGELGLYSTAHSEDLHHRLSVIDTEQIFSGLQGSRQGCICFF